VSQSAANRDEEGATDLATGKKDASLAGKQLKSPKSTPAQKSVAGSDLSQTKGKKKKKKKKKKKN
jgi:hypothetical protein